MSSGAPVTAATTTRRRATAALEATRGELEKLEAENRAARRKTNDITKRKRRRNQQRETLGGDNQDSSLLMLFDVEDESDDFDSGRDDDDISTHNESSPFSGFGGGGSFAKFLTNKKHHQPFDDYDDDESDDKDQPTSALTHENFTAFIELSRLQANETMRRKTEAKLESIVHLPREERAAAYCVSSVDPSFDFHLDDMELSMLGQNRESVMAAIANASFAEPGEEFAAVRKRRRSSISAAAAQDAAVMAEQSRTGMLVMMGRSSTAMGASIAARRRASVNTLAGASTANVASGVFPGLGKSTTTRFLESGGVDADGKNKNNNNNEKDDDDAALNSLVKGGGHHSSASGGGGGQQGLRQVKAAQSAAAIANEQQRKIVRWRNADDTGLIKRATGTLEDAALRRQEERVRGEMTELQQLHAEILGGGAKTATFLERQELLFEEDRVKREAQKNAGRVQTTIVGFEKLAVDDTTFDAAVSALTAEAQAVQKAGLRNRWWAQQRANKIEYSLRRRIHDAVERGEKQMRDAMSRHSALESLFPAAMCEANQAALAAEEERDRWTVVADERAARNELRVVLYSLF